MSNTTPLFSVKTLSPEPPLVLNTPAGRRGLPAQFFLDALHRRFPEASPAMLEILLQHNAVYVMHLAHQHHLLNET